MKRNVSFFVLWVVIIIVICSIEHVPVTKSIVEENNLSYSIEKGNDISKTSWSPTGGGNHRGANWSLNDGDEISGIHWDINEFYIEKTATVDVKGWNNDDKGKIEIHANRIIINGSLNAQGKGFDKSGSGGGSDGNNGDQLGDSACGAGGGGGGGGSYGGKGGKGGNGGSITGANAGSGGNSGSTYGDKISYSILACRNFQDYNS